MHYQQIFNKTFIVIAIIDPAHSNILLMGINICIYYSVEKLIIKIKTKCLRVLKSCYFVHHPDITILKIVSKSDFFTL